MISLVRPKSTTNARLLTFFMDGSENFFHRLFLFIKYILALIIYFAQNDKCVRHAFCFQCFTTFHQSIPAQLWQIWSRAFRTFLGHAHFSLWECTKWALLTYIRVTSGGSKASARERLQSQPASLGLASPLNYGRCIIQDAAHTFSSSSRAKVRLNKGAIYERATWTQPCLRRFL